MQSRCLEPEFLDTLSPGDAGAVASRRDLARINAVMGQHIVMTRRLRAFSPPRLLLDLGSGDGRFLLRVARRLGRRWRGVTALLADRQDILADETRQGFARLGWGAEVCQGDVFDALEAIPAGDVLITANLFLHHLGDADLQRLFEVAASRAQGVVACEPRRSRLALAASHMVWALGCNAITRHDAVASVRAGFRDGELTALWPKAAGWTITESAAFAFSHGFTARHDV